MTSFFQEIFKYHHHYNQKLIDEIKRYQNNLPERTFPLFCHMLSAHQVWNSRILGFAPFAVWQVHEIDRCADIDEDNYKQTLNILENDDLERIIDYKTSKGQPFSNSIRDILFHVANHSAHHKGQIISDFRTKNIEPIITDYIFYKR